MSPSSPVPDSQPDGDRAERLSRLCADVAEVADLLGPEPARALAALQDRTLPVEDVDAVLAEVSDLLRAGGLVGTDAASRGVRYLPLPGIEGRRPEVVLVCPGNLCDRVEMPRAGAGASPVCAVWDRALPEFRMDR